VEVQKEKTASGYLMIYIPQHPNNDNGYVLNSRLVVEKTIGKFLPKKAIVHHFDNNRTNDRNDNLVVCESIQYHNLLHRRAVAYKECGHPNWRKCRYCKKYDDPVNMYQEPFVKSKYTDSCRHRECFNKYMREYNSKRKK
jgi:hypothetical protein